MRWQGFDRWADGWAIGLISKWGWLHLANIRGTMFLDVWHWRIRWAKVGYRPYFSERYGYVKWHKIGRLGVCRVRRGA